MDGGIPVCPRPRLRRWRWRLYPHRAFGLHQRGRTWHTIQHFRSGHCLQQHPRPMALCRPRQWQRHGQKYYTHHTTEQRSVGGSRQRYTRQYGHHHQRRNVCFVFRYGLQPRISHRPLKMECSRRCGRCHMVGPAHPVADFWWCHHQVRQRQHDGCWQHHHER